MQFIRYLWAGPWTLLGLSLGLLGVATGGSYQRIGGAIEFHGGILPNLLRRAPIPNGASAITIGHTVLGRSSTELSQCRDHEQIHIRQYERWGPFFVPAYLSCSAYVWLRGGDPYRDNPFEREAYGEEREENCA